jgi:hypothetical protein
MQKFKEMPYKEKYELAMENIEFFKLVVPAFLKEHIGDQAVNKLQGIWKEDIKSIPDDVSFEDKYETAYGNWISMAKSNFIFIREYMGEEGIKLLMRDEVEALKRKNAGPAVFFLSLIRAIAPGQAFVMTNKEFSYQLQWITPFSVTELNKEKAVFDIPRCKVLDFQDTEDICVTGCQGIYPMWVAEQFKVRMGFERKGNSCVCTISHLN